MEKNTTKGFLFIITATVLWAFAGPLAKYLFGIGITPTDLVQARVTYSCLILLLFFTLFNRVGLKIDRQDMGYFALLGIVGFALVQYTYFYSISKLDVGIAISIQYTAPTLIVIYSALFLKEKIGVKTVLAILLALIGCFLVIGAYDADWSNLNEKGILGALFSAVVFAFYTIYGEKGLKKYPAWTVFFYAVLFATIFWNVIHPPFALVGQGWSWEVWSGILGVAIFGTLIPFALFFMALKHLDPIRLSVTSTLEPIFATIVAFVALGETLTFWQICGGVFIIASVILMATKRPESIA